MIMEKVKSKHRNKKYSQEEAEAIYRDRGCELLSKYVNNSTKNFFKCKCGRLDKISISSLLSGHFCKCCGYEIAAAKNRYSIEYLSEFFKKAGCRLITNNYINNDQILEFVCVCDRIGQKRFYDFKNAPRCKKCGDDIKRNKMQYNLAQVREIFKSHGCVLLSGNYVNNKSKLKYRCECRNIGYTTLNKLLHGYRCKKCYRQKIRAALSLTYEEVAAFFVKNNCLLLSKHYVNSSQRLKYQCECGRIAKITFNNFRNGQRCQNCGIKKLQKTFRHSYEKVEQFFKDNGCVLLSDNYENSRSTLKFQCSCGNIGYSSYHDFKLGRRCRKCGEKRIQEAQKFTYDKVYQIFTSFNCKLLSKEYINSKTPLIFECKCGNISTITLERIEMGYKCRNCNVRKLERICRDYLEKLFNCKLIKSRPNWLRNKNNNRLELDGYDEKEKIAFEHQGRQHFEFMSFFHKTSEDSKTLKEHDKIKRKCCKKRNILLIIIPELYYFLHPESLPDHVKKYLISNSVPLPENIDNISVTPSGQIIIN